MANDLLNHLSSPSLYVKLVDGGMEKNFMISIQFEGRTLYANVFEYRHSPAVYHVQFIDYSFPAQLKLYERDGDILPDDSEQANAGLVQEVIRAIKNSPHRI